MAHGIVKYSQELKYGHCLNCFGYYSRKSYARHRCITNKKSAKDLKRKAAPIKEGDAALQVKVNLLSPEAANIMASMNDDAVGRKWCRKFWSYSTIICILVLFPSVFKSGLYYFFTFFHNSPYWINNKIKKWTIIAANYFDTYFMMMTHLKTPGIVCIWLNSWFLCPRFSF